MFRTMKIGDDGRPLVGRGRNKLGVKVSPPLAEPPPLSATEFDVYPDLEGFVGPGRGMSVAMDDPRNLPFFRKPRALGGESRLPLFQL
jgi:hypothetical protein